MKIVVMYRNLSSLLAAMILLSGCAVFDDRPAEERVLDRAQQHLAALRAGKFDEALKYTTPSFQASARGRRYRAIYSAAPTWRDAEVYAVECEDAEKPEKCVVRTRIYPFIPPHIQANITGLPVSVSKDWIYTEDDWYRYEE